MAAWPKNLPTAHLCPGHCYEASGAVRGISVRRVAIKTPNVEAQKTNGNERTAKHDQQDGDKTEGDDHLCTFPQEGQRLPAKIRAEHREQQRYEL